MKKILLHQNGLQSLRRAGFARSLLPLVLLRCKLETNEDAINYSFWCIETTAVMSHTNALNFAVRPTKKACKTLNGMIFNTANNLYGSFDPTNEVDALAVRQLRSKLRMMVMVESDGTQATWCSVKKMRKHHLENGERMWQDGAERPTDEHAQSENYGHRWSGTCDEWAVEGSWV